MASISRTRSHNRDTQQPYRMSTPSIQKFRRMFEVLRWMSVLAVVVLPFTFSHGALSVGRIIAALAFGLCWLGLNVVVWRKRSDLLLLCQSILFVVVGNGFLSNPEVRGSTSLQVQWMCLVVIAAGVPLLIAKSWFIKAARLDSLPVPFTEADRSS